MRRFVQAAALRRIVPRRIAPLTAHRRITSKEFTDQYNKQVELTRNVLHYVNTYDINSEQAKEYAGIMEKRLAALKKLATYDYWARFDKIDILCLGVLIGGTAYAETPKIAASTIGIGAICGWKLIKYKRQTRVLEHLQERCKRELNVLNIKDPTNITM